MSPFKLLARTGAHLNFLPMAGMARCASAAQTLAQIRAYWPALPSASTRAGTSQRDVPTNKSILQETEVRLAPVLPAGFI
jgi:hypothetical protein